VGEDLWWEGLLEKMCLEWKRVGVMDGDSGSDGAGRPRLVE